MRIELFSTAISSNSCLETRKQLFPTAWQMHFLVCSTKWCFWVRLILSEETQPKTSALTSGTQGTCRQPGLFVVSSTEHCRSWRNFQVNQDSGQPNLVTVFLFFQREQTRKWRNPIKLVNVAGSEQTVGAGVLGMVFQEPGDSSGVTWSGIPSRLRKKWHWISPSQPALATQTLWCYLPLIKHKCFQRWACPIWVDRHGCLLWNSGLQESMTLAHVISQTHKTSQLSAEQLHPCGMAMGWRHPCFGLASWEWLNSEWKIPDFSFVNLSITIIFSS